MKNKAKEDAPVVLVNAENIIKIECPVLDSVVSTYGSLPMNEVYDLCHDEEPWKSAFVPKKNSVIEMQKASDFYLKETSNNPSVVKNSLHMKFIDTYIGIVSSKKHKLSDLNLKLEDVINTPLPK